MGKWDVPIQVCVRKRPALKKELSKRAIDVVTMTTACYPHASVFVHEPKVGLDQSHTISTQHFAFDKIYDEDAGNDYIYRTTLEPAIPKLFEGENVSLFAYGATGSGKTRTHSNIGLYQYACSHVFQMAQDYPGIDLFVSFLEIYSGRVYDLLNGRQQVKLLEQNGNFYFQGLQEYPVTSLAETQALMAHGMSTRSTGSTEVNNTSSRSHAIFRLELRPRPGAATATLSSSAMLSLIDLAGSERGVDTPNSSTDRRREGAAINQSLLALKECIRALHVKSGYVPFRSSKLTCVLRDCFRPEAAASGVGAGSRCIMVLNVAPTSVSVEQTLSCLHYANRVKEYSHGGTVVGGNAGKNISAQELIEQLAAMSPSPIEAMAGGGFEGEMERAMGQPPVSELLMDEGEDEEAYDEFEGAASDVISHPRSDEELAAGYVTDPDVTLDESEILDLGPDSYEADEDGEHGFSTPRVMSYDDNFAAAGGYDNTKTPVASTLAIDSTSASGSSKRQPRSRVATYSEDDLMDLHRSTITSMTNLLREEHALMEDRVQDIVDTDVYVTALDILIDEKMRKLLKLKAMAQVVRQMNDIQLEGGWQGSDMQGQPKSPTLDEVREKVRELRRGPTPT
ncbi:P-loop containing nucleoside triphosphate hydrolase protein [Catenaria anguillulae PL171]|uniref:Kinesin-like protein n=1 Tax=Catenaria anguillulae PL171 TaxID=765915 RepID=A0A1Y2HAG6_9FUNG|nr:P-loop containing nucleoside triphosphate hydrolase protein [Catenaria anguillulae PL171]